jgi:hypothetical protein
MSSDIRPTSAAWHLRPTSEASTALVLMAVVFMAANTTIK